MKTRALAIALGLFVLTAPAPAGPDEPLTVTDLDGTVHRPFATKETRAAVFLFIATDCPIANSYQPTLRKLAATYGPKGVAFFQVHPDPDLDAAEARRHGRDFEITIPIVIDRKQTLVRRLDAHVTPEAFVLTPDLATAYRGRIDNTYATYGKRRPAPTQHDLEDALQAVLAGRKVAVPKTEAVGCRIFVEPR